MTFDPDILERIKSDFRPADRNTVIDALTAADRNGRITRCILVAARGSVQRVEELLELADLDCRDVIVAGEYDLTRPVRDLRVSFLIDCPNHFWISDVAILAHRHGYRVTKLDSETSSRPPFAEVETGGIVTFTNGRQLLTIRKHEGRWSVIVDGVNLASFGLDSPLGDENRFRVQLDLLLSRMDAEQTDAPKRRSGAV